jgi:hypothetical protein
VNIFKRWAAWGAVGIGLVIGACATSPEPFEYQPENELKSGPGLFSGDDGVFTLYGKPAAASTEEGEGQRQEGGASEAIAPDAP